MKFRFRLESVLNVRQRKEDLAQADYLKAKAQVDQCLMAIKQMYDDISKTREMVHQSQKTRAVGQISSMQVGHDFIKGSMIKIDRKREEARELMRIAEDKLEILKSAMVERKAIEKLKEKQKAEFQKARKKKEREFFGDIAIMRAGRADK
ncbi:MAG: flagellar export protein FliJ [Bdellovibrionales bacterium]|nr:flagellar export protein FliJ [Bdellovibrionales bacterium]